MIVMSVALDNLYGFQEFSSISYPKKIVRSRLLMNTSQGVLPSDTNE